jgi:3-oxoacyl-[acyl-carrier protein] reductase
MDLGIAGKTALVAASTGGLGLAVARALAAEGVRVAIVGRRRDRAKEIVAELQTAYGHTVAGAGEAGVPGFDAVAIEADLTTPEGIESAIEQTMADLGPIDILVLNGPGPKPGAAATLSSEDIAAAFDLLVKPHHALISHVLPGMRERRWGRILALGSSGVVAPLPNLAVSNTGRAALAGYLKTLAAEVALDSVTVNMLLPGRIATDRVAELDHAAAKRRGTTLEDIQLESRKTIPARRYGEPGEFGAAAAFLCSAPASYITGVALRCDGGLIRSL